MITNWEFAAGKTYEVWYSEHMPTLIAIILWVLIIASWFTHIVTCLATGMWGFLIAGALLFPIGIIHGVMIWFGYGY